MKSTATEYFRSLSPVKTEAKSSTLNMYTKPMLNGKAGRCHCCPYGYHIDLDFVRYCQVLNQGAKNANPTLVKLKNLKKERRRQTKSIEAMLGIPVSLPDEDRAWFIEPNYTSSLTTNCSESTSFYKKPVYPTPSSVPTPPPRERKKFFSPPSPPPRKQSLTHPALKSPPPPDLINSSKLFPSKRSDQASEALQEAVLDFEVALESSRDQLKKKQINGSNYSTIDLLHHTPNYSSRFNFKPSVGRSNSLPRQFLYESGSQYAPRNQYIKDYNGSYSATNTLNGYGSYNQSPSLMNDAMAALNAARGLSANQPQDIDTVSMTSAMSGVSTSTLQSIRDQMATGLSRLKDLEDEVRNIPKLQIKYNILKEEKRILLEQVRCFQRGEEPPLSLPSVLKELEDLTDDDLDGRLQSLRKNGKGSLPRNRSVSPMRVNLEDFHSYRRARRGSVSEGSDNESTNSYHPRDRSQDRDERNRLYITESGDSDWKRGRKTTASLPATPLTHRRCTTRDVAVSCRAITRDVGVSHMAPRSRSVGTGTVPERIEKKPCEDCEHRKKKVLVTKCVGTIPYKRDSGHLNSVFSESLSHEEHDTKAYEHGSSKNSLLEKLGKKSPIVNRLSSSQLFPPVLTFDNSTNTEPVRNRDQRTNTSLKFDDLFTREDLDDAIREAKKQWENTFKRASVSPIKEIIKKPITIDRGIQTRIEIPKVKTQNVGSMAKQSTRDVGSGYFSIDEEQKVSPVRTRSVACSTDPPALNKTTRSKSIGVGDCRITDINCVDCAKRQANKLSFRSIGCGIDKIDDIVCDKCTVQKRHVGVGDCRITDDICKKCKMKRMTSTGCQVKPSMRTVAVDVDLILTPKEPVLPATPEIDRRPFGSSGVRVCDKCHETITSVAKDIVLTGVSPTATIGAQSKIPRLVDHQNPDVSPVIVTSKPIDRTNDRSSPVILPMKREKSFTKSKENVASSSSVNLEKSSKLEKSDVDLLKKDGATKVDDSSQIKRAPYNRQDTYVKTGGSDSNGGFVNLGFEELEAKKGDWKRDSKSPQKPTGKLEEKPQSEVPIVKVTDADIKTVIKEEEISSNSSDQEEPGDDVSSIAASSVATMDTQTTEADPNKQKKRAQPSREMKAALKVLNDSIGKSFRSGQQLNNAINIIQREWFKVSGQKDADPHAVEHYMDAFEKFSKALLSRIVNLSDINGNTAMHYAVSHGNFDVVSVLLDSKVCNINQQNKAGYTATMLVALAPIKNAAHASVVKKLFEVGDINIKASQHGQTALMLAVSHGRLDMVKMLMPSGSDPNIQDEDGSTALMCAAEHGHLAIVRYLVAQPDTDLYLMDNDGSTALTIAVEAGHKDVGVLLYKQMNLSRGSSPYGSIRGGKKPRTPTMARASMTPPPRSSAPSSPGRSRKSSGRASPATGRQSSASLSNLNF